MKENWTMTTHRRDFLAGTVALGASGLAGAGALAFGKDPKSAGKGAAEEAIGVSPVEDLMREHGVLKRVLLIYEEGLRRLDAKQDVPLKALADGARIIRSFIEDYHGKLEEDLSAAWSMACWIAVEASRLPSATSLGRQITTFVFLGSPGKGLGMSSTVAACTAAGETSRRMPHGPSRKDSTSRRLPPRVEFSGAACERKAMMRVMAIFPRR
jgi:hypothetical protein